MKQERDEKKARGQFEDVEGRTYTRPCMLLKERSVHSLRSVSGGTTI